MAENEKLHFWKIWNVWRKLDWEEIFRPYRQEEHFRAKKNYSPGDCSRHKDAQLPRDQEAQGSLRNHAEAQGESSKVTQPTPQHISMISRTKRYDSHASTRDQLQQQSS